MLQLVAVNSLGSSPASNQITLTLPAPTGPIQQIGSDILSPDLSFGSHLALSANGGRIVVSAYATANGTTRRLRTHRRHLDAARRRHHRGGGWRHRRHRRRHQRRRHARRRRCLSQRRRGDELRSCAGLRPRRHDLDAGGRGPEWRRVRLGTGLERGTVGERQPPHHGCTGQRHHDRSREGLRARQRDVDPTRGDTDGWQ